MATTVKTLRLLFRDEMDRLRAINLPEPEENLDVSDIEDCMNHIVDKDIFATAGGALVEKIRAEVVERSVDEIYDAS